MVDKENHASLGPKLPSASRTENNSLCSLPFLSFGRFQETGRERRESVRGSQCGAKFVVSSGNRQG